MRLITIDVPLAVGLVLFVTRPAHSDVSVSDVGPEAGLVFTNNHQPFLFRGQQDVLVTSGRAGIYKTTDGGANWVRRQRGLITPIGVEPYATALCQSRSAPEIAYVATILDGVARTPDFGETWGPPTPLKNVELTDCAVDPTDPAVVYALAPLVDPLSSGILFKSIDGGRSFSRVGAGLPDSASNFMVAIAPTNAQTLYVATYVGLYVSSDGGFTFRGLPNLPSYPISIHPHPTEDGTLLVAAEELFLSTDGGATFALVGTGLPPYATVAFDPTDPTVVYGAAGADGLFRSLDGGLTFERLNGLGEEELRGLGVIAVGITPAKGGGPSVIYAGTSLGPFRSDDGGATFVAIHNGYRGTQVNDLAIDAKGRLLVGAINTIGVFRSSTPGVYETIGDTLPRYPATRLASIAAAADDPNFYVIGANSDYIYWTSDGGGSWTRSVIPGDPRFGTPRIAFAPSDSRRVYAVALAPPGLYRSNDGARSFERVQTQGFGSIAVDPSDPNVLYVGSRLDGRGLFKSNDGGTTLQALTPVGNFAAIAIDPVRTEIVYAARQGSEIIRSLDGGQTFSSVTNGLVGDRVLGLGIDPGAPTRLFAWMHAGGLFRTDDRGDSWMAIDTGETLRRSTGQAGTTALVIDPTNPEHVYLGNGSVLQVEIVE